MLSTGSLLCAPRSAVSAVQKHRSSHNRATSHANARKAAKARARIPLASFPIASAASRSSSSLFLLDDDDDDDAPPPTRAPADYANLLLAAEVAGDWVRAVELVAEARVLRVRLPAEGYEAAARAAAEHGEWEKAVGFLARAARATPLPLSSSSSSSSSSFPPPPPACSAIVSVFSRLAREVQAEAVMELLEMLRGGEGHDGEDDDRGNSSSSSSPSSSSWRSRPAETRSITLNCAARACARASTGGAKMMLQNDDGSDRNRGNNEQQQRQQQLSDEDRTIFFESSLRLLDDLREESLRIEDGTFGAVALAALAAGRPDLSEELLEERDYL